MTALAAALVGCQTEATDDSASLAFAKSTTTIAIEVDYVAGAEPYVANGADADPWRITRDNMNALFDGKRTIEVPSALADMEKISAPAGDYSSEEIVAIAKEHRSKSASRETASVYVVFLNGYFEANGERQNDTLGVTIAEEGVVAMFKPVIESTELRAFPGIVRVTEQLVLVHELGHALGLVNNGVEMASAHQDAAHGAHCSNTSCVMYWANEGPRDVIELAKKVQASGSAVAFGSECLNDAKRALE